MSKGESIKIQSDGIAQVLSTRRLKVPTYQRSYAWEDQHVKQLFQDLTTALQTKEQDYFLGSIVITSKESDRPEVVDGQQRLATVTILLSAIRDYFFSKGDTSRVEDIERDFLASRDRRTQDQEPNLMLNEIDNDFFQQRIISRPDSGRRGMAATHESHERIARAAELAKEHVESLVKVNANPTEVLMDLIDYIQETATVILVEAADHSNAFVIFETLNDRGLNLSLSDLLKNFLFGRSGKRLSETQQRWFSMTGVLEEEIMITFIRHLWASKYGATRERDLYLRIKESITSESAALSFATELAEDAQLYAAMLNPSHEYWDTYKGQGEVRRHLEALKLLRMEQIRPLLLAILKEFSEEEVQKSLGMLVAWAVRFLIVGGLGGGTLEKHYSGAAVEIRKHTVKTANGLAKYMKDVVPSDKQFEDAFTIAVEKRAPFARYYLCVLERAARGEQHPEMVPNEEVEAVNLEHILPVKAGTDWNYIDADTIMAFVMRIGNMTLMKTKLNNAAANSGFIEKQKEYSKSEFVLTKELNTKYVKWDADEIGNRQKALAALAVQAWPLSI